MRSLEELRNELDRIDPQIIQLYEERMSVCEEVGEIKIEEGRKVFDRNREQQKLAQVTREAKDPFYKKGLTEYLKKPESLRPTTPRIAVMIRSRLIISKRNM